MKLEIRTPRGLPAVAHPDEVAALLAIVARAKLDSDRADVANHDVASRWRAAGRVYDA